ncbi:MAG: NADH-quinone oxidoreductase subunit M [Candidatus Goldbacteria bacterium]|nr:NADH-quinone oxidoreductase subunit M [Candidatus Goldiibacteriota bacterium]
MEIFSFIKHIPVLTIIYIMPLISVLILLFIPGSNHRAIRLVALIPVCFSFFLSILLLINYDYNLGGLQFVEKHTWIPSLGINYFLGVNGINVALVLLTGFVIVAGVLASWDITYRPKEFFMLLLTLVTGVFGVFMTYNLFLFFLFYEIAVLPMYLLIGIWGTGDKEYSAMKLTLYLLVGSALILAGILGLYFATGLNTFDFDVLEQYKYTKEFQIVFFPILFLGFGVLAALWPFHTWSPDGHASAPTAVSMLHAGVLMKLGAYGCLVVATWLLPEGANFWLPLVAVLTVVNIVYGSTGAVAQKDLKYIVAYSSVSHMGIVLLGIAAAKSPIALSGSVFQMVSHGIMTGLFFALVGMVYGRTHTRIITEMRGLSKVMPKLATFFTLTGLCSLGLPGLSGFVAEITTFIGAFKIYPVITLICVVSIVITAFYVLRVVQIVFFGPIMEEYKDLKDANNIEFASLFILTIFVILFGIYPFYFMKVIYSSVLPIAQKLSSM